MTTLPANELARLERFLSAHENRFALALVRIPQFPLREELTRWVEEFSRERARSFHRFDFTGLRFLEIWRVIERGVPEGAIVLLDGLDSALNEPDGDVASLLNRQRERIAELLPGPVLLMLGDAAMTRFVTDAPDLADWHAATFEFEPERILERMRVEGHAIPGLSSEWIASRINLLERQLRWRMPDRTRARILLELGRLHQNAALAVPADSAKQQERNVVPDLQGAEAALREAINILRRRAKEDSDPQRQLDLAEALNDLAELYHDTWRYEESTPLFEESLKIREQVLGPEHPDTLYSVNNLALSYRRQGRYLDAEPLYHRSVEALIRGDGS